MNTETPDARKRFKLRKKHVILLSVAAMALIAGGILIALASMDRAVTKLSANLFAPEQEGEFLVIIAPFYRAGGDPQPIGGALANDLRSAPLTEDLYRVETLPVAPTDDMISEILEAYSPSVLVTGQYDGRHIDAVVRLAVAAPPPPPSAIEHGVATLLPEPTPITYRVYAPQGLEKPLQYLQFWIAGQSLFWRGRYDAALPLLRETKRLLPRQIPLDRRSEMDRFVASVAWQLGYIAGPVQNHWQAARDLFDEALRLDPKNPLNAIGLAAALAQLDDLNAASEILRAALRDDSNAWRVYFALAEILAQQKQFEAAEAAYTQSIELLSLRGQPGDDLILADIYVSRGFFYLGLEDYQAAASDFEKSLELGRNDAAVQSALSWAAYRLGDYETAVRAAAAARQMLPERPDLAFNEALFLLAAGQTDAANIAYDEAITLTLTIDDVVQRSTYFGVAYQDLDALLAQRPELEAEIRAIQERIDIANG
ncbi:MAG: tetratricopeptide repeat protein [Chloroflexi bacterium]|nr:tetratricopeptide repeat protein [Chloroflexota bacterium]